MNSKIRPKPRREGGFLVAARVSIDGGCTDARVAHPLLHHVERHGSLQRADGKAVTEAARTCGTTNDARLQHRAFHQAPRCYPRERPKAAVRGLGIALT